MCVCVIPRAGGVTAGQHARRRPEGSREGEGDKEQRERARGKGRGPGGCAQVAGARRRRPAPRWPGAVSSLESAALPAQETTAPPRLEPPRCAAATCWRWRCAAGSEGEGPRSAAGGEPLAQPPRHLLRRRRRRRRRELTSGGYQAWPGPGMRAKGGHAR